MRKTMIDVPHGNSYRTSIRKTCFLVFMSRTQSLINMWLIVQKYASFISQNDFYSTIKINLLVFNINEFECIFSRSP